MPRPASLLALLVLPLAATVALEARSGLELQRRSQPKEKEKGAHKLEAHGKAQHKPLHDEAGHKAAAHGKDHDKSGHKVAAHKAAAHDKAGHKAAAHDKAGHKAVVHGKAHHESAKHEKAQHKAALHGKAEHKVALHGKTQHKSVAAHAKLKHGSALHQKAGHKSALHEKAGKAGAKDKKKKAGKAKDEDEEAETKTTKKAKKAAAKDENADEAEPVEEVVEDDGTDKESPAKLTKGKAAAVDDSSICAAPVNGSKCFNSVTWLKREGFRLHPEWYPAYSSQSTFQEVQAMLFSLGKSECPKPCGQESTTSAAPAAPADPDSEEEDIGGTPRPAAGSTVHYDEESQDEPAEKQSEVPVPFKPDVVAEEETPAPAPEAAASESAAAAASAATTPEPEPSGPPRPPVLLENPANSVDEEMLPRVGKDAADVM
ncbi:unnamed protein product [Prorocentrum cordatum]|uniref:Uncharacterized protein n=1 Tax=Prorocentrum cordatum TaxID=2364126 RepID=A0ABN9RFI7_9DINO|nr:unnamed protein product [Polarella glacialis]